MNIKDILLFFGLTLVTTWMVDYLFLRRYRVDVAEVRSGQVFNVPEREHAIRPLNGFIEIADKKKVGPVVLTEVNTDWATLIFSSEGACLERAEYKRSGGDKDPAITIYPGISSQTKAFFVAFDQYTPYHYKFIDIQDVGVSFIISYQAHIQGNIFSKKFVVDKRACKIDVICEYSGTESIGQARLFYPSPTMPDVKQDVICGVVSNAQGVLEKTAASKLSLQSGWWAPSIFGTENRYFAHVLISGGDNILERAYYILTQEGNLVSVLESHAICGGAWGLSFYMGPKESSAIELVDLRLDAVLDYSGILAPLSKLLLAMLIFLYSYVHNYGVAILLLTLLIKLLLLPFAIKGEKSLKKSQDMQKKMQYLQQKYKNDQELFRVKQAELIQKEGMPQLASCLPMLLQFPIFIALNRVLANSIELYKAPFFGWITDLSAPDPYYIFPICITLAMMLQALYGDQNQRMALMTAALVFGVVSLQFSAGLVLYICASTVLGIAQIWVQKKLKDGNA